MTPCMDPARLDLEYWRLDVMKRMYRLGAKDPIKLELIKARDIIDYMLKELEKQ